MNAADTQRRNFIPYPTNRVVGTVTNSEKAREAIGALLQAGFPQDDVDLLQGEEGLHRLDQDGAQHGFLAQVQRTVIRTFDLDEFKHLTHHVEDVRAGRCVLMVLTRRREQRLQAAEILHQHGAAFVGFYGRWAWADLPPNRQASPSDIPQAFAQAWNAGDPDALASLFDEDADFVNVTGVCWHDRASIRNAHANHPVNIATVEPESTTVKLMSPDIAVVQARMTFEGEAPHTSIVSFVVHRIGDRWLCASAHSSDVVPEKETSH